MKVSAIMPTRGRLEFARKALESWRAQGYENKELVIVDDADDPSFPSEMIPGRTYKTTIIAGIEHLSVIYRRIQPGASIGSKRNIAADAASGDLIAHFDSDDYSAPERIADQVQRLIESGKSVTGYHSMRFTDGERWWKNTNPPHWAYDTSLCYRKSFWESHKFDPINDGLEASFRNAAIREKQFIAVDAGDMMYASIHEGNTSRRHIGEGWQEIEAPK